MRISAIYLAAGQGRRMGVRKQSLELAEHVPLARIALHALSQSRLEQAVIVMDAADNGEWLPEELPRVPLELDGLKKLRVVKCEDAPLGMAYSLRAGMKELLRMDAELESVIVMLADQPFITVRMLEQLVERFRSDRELDYVAYRVHDGALSPPVLLSRSMFNELLTLRGDIGARKLLSQPHLKGVLLNAEGEELLDVDTPEDLALARSCYARNAETV